jgi:hypothetical protein
MGVKTLTPIASQLSPITPAAKDVQTNFFQVARTDTVSSLKGAVPADATILNIVRSGSVASNALTTATVTIMVTNNLGTVSTKADDVKTSGATTGFVEMSNLPNTEPLPLVGDLTISAVYAETGTASTLGGPWNYTVFFVR